MLACMISHSKFVWGKKRKIDNSMRKFNKFVRELIITYKTR